MGKTTIILKLKQFIASLGFKLFIWGNETTPEKYWDEVYQQELAHKQSKVFNPIH